MATAGKNKDASQAFASAVSHLAAGKAEAPAAEERAKSQLWANIGLTAKGAGQEGEDVFISLPYGVPVDTMTPSTVPTKPGYGRNMFNAKNALLTELQAMGADLKPGESIVVQLEVQLQRINDVAAAEATDAENPLLQAIKLR